MRDQLAKIIVNNSYLRATSDDPFVLASGKTSTFYFDCQRTTLFAEAMPLIGKLMLDRLADVNPYPRSVGGLAQGANPIAQAIAQASLESKRGVVNAFSVRKAKKDHGTMRWIEGWVKTGDPVVIVDDVITSGGSVIKAIDRCDDEKLRILKVVVLVDRQQGGLDAIQARIPGVPVEALFTKTELDEVDARERGRPVDGSVD
jgi:orotate phosphoribosyltransferase